MEELESIAKNPRQEDLNKDTEDSDYSGDENEIIPKENRDSKEKDHKKSADAKEPRDNTAEKIQLIKKKLPPSLKPKKK